MYLKQLCIVLMETDCWVGSGARLMMQLALTSGGGYSRSVKCLQRVATANVNRPSLLPPARLLTYYHTYSAARFSIPVDSFWRIESATLSGRHGYNINDSFSGTVWKFKCRLPLSVMHTIGLYKSIHIGDNDVISSCQLFFRHDVEQGLRDVCSRDITFLVRYW